MRIPVFSLPWNCWKCGKEMKLTYPTTEDVYKTDYRGNLAPTYSNTRKEKLIGNLCPYCKAYQGNFFVWDNGIMANAYELEDHLVGFFEKEIKCRVCGTDIEQLDKEDLFTKLQIYQDRLDFDELSPTKKEEERKLRVEALDSFSLCQDCTEIESAKNA